MPSIPSESWTKAPNLVRLTIGPSIRPPAGNFCAASFQGSPSACFSPTEIRLSGALIENHDFHHLAGLHRITRLAHPFAPGHLGNVNQSFDSRFEFDERTKVHQARDGAPHTLANPVLGRNCVPG